MREREREREKNTEREGSLFFNRLFCLSLYPYRLLFFSHSLFQEMFFTLFLFQQVVFLHLSLSKGCFFASLSVSKLFLFFFFNGLFLSWILTKLEERTNEVSLVGRGGL